MNCSERGLDLIKSFEGYHRKLPDGNCIAYRCPAGVWTLGWGCTEGITAGMIWTPQHAEDALRREIAKFEAAVHRLVSVSINQNQFDALVSFAYNCGEGALGKSTLLKRLNAGDYEGAAKGFAQWNKGGGRVLPGLVTRRAKEAALFLEDATPAEAPSMPQQVDEPEQPPPAEQHRETHEALRRDSWAYWLNHLNIRVLGMAGAVIAFLREHALEIVAAIVAAIVVFELYQLHKRQQRIKAQ